MQRFHRYVTSPVVGWLTAHRKLVHVSATFFSIIAGIMILMPIGVPYFCVYPGGGNTSTPHRGWFGPNGEAAYCQSKWTPLAGHALRSALNYRPKENYATCLPLWYGCIYAFAVPGVDGAPRDPTSFEAYTDIGRKSLTIAVLAFVSGMFGLVLGLIGCCRCRCCVTMSASHGRQPIIAGAMGLFAILSWAAAGSLPSQDWVYQQPWAVASCGYDASVPTALFAVGGLLFAIVAALFWLGCGATVKPTVSAVFNATIPAGVAPGQTFTATTPDGQQQKVQVPSGAAPGTQVQVSYTPNDAPRTAEPCCACCTTVTTSVLPSLVPLGP